LQEFSSRPHNIRGPNKKNGRCKKKEYGKGCNEKAYGVFNGEAQCKRHYNDSVRLERRHIENTQ
jgi:hypothetical protein